MENISSLEFIFRIKEKTASYDTLITKVKPKHKAKFLRIYRSLTDHFKLEKYYFKP